MTQIKVDKEKCVGCGSCIELCPYKALRMHEQKADYFLEACFLCGHCEAVCPVGAVQMATGLSALNLANVVESQSVKTLSSLETADLVSLMRSRRSCRRYKKENVSMSILEDLVKIGTTAPSGTNSQGWNFTILPTRDEVLVLGGRVAKYFKKLNRQAESVLLRTIIKYVGGDSLGRYYRNHYPSVSEALREWEDDGVDRLFHGAPATLLVTGKLSSSCPAEDALLATQNILLAAHSMGLGSCLIGFAVEAMRRDLAIMKKMDIPDGEQIYSVIALGIPVFEFKRPARRRAVLPRVLRFDREN